MKHTTPVPNRFFDILLSKLTESEIKVYLTIVRQTLGWKGKYKKTRKQRDRITHSQFVTKTGLSRRIISSTINSLVVKELIKVTDYDFNVLNIPQSRKGKSYLYYEVIHKPMQNDVSTCAKSLHKPVKKGAYNKRKLSKETITKGNSCGLTPITNYLKLRCKE